MRDGEVLFAIADSGGNNLFIIIIISSATIGIAIVVLLVAGIFLCVHVVKKRRSG